MIKKLPFLSELFYNLILDRLCADEQITRLYINKPRGNQPVRGGSIAEKTSMRMAI